MATTSAETTAGNKYLIALVAALGLIPIALDATIVNVVLTPIRVALHADVDTAQWIITGYFLANAAVIAVGGYLANRYGRKRVFILGLALFTIGSGLCALSPTMTWLIAFRILQGVGGGLLLPIGPALAFDGFPKEERAKASALIGVPLLLAPVFGPIAGGYLNDTFDWHTIFIINLPVGAVSGVPARTDKQITWGAFRCRWAGALDARHRHHHLRADAGDAHQSQHSDGGQSRRRPLRLGLLAGLDAGWRGRGHPGRLRLLLAAHQSRSRAGPAPTGAT